MPEKFTEVKDLPDRGTRTGVSDTYGADLSGSAINREGAATGAEAGPENPGCADDGGSVKLDQTRPYADVIGMPGVCYEQDNRYFAPDGGEVLKKGDSSEKSAAPAKDDDSFPDPPQKDAAA